ncbi:hypothetical protein BSKO_06821 [Bryopsis sp. KO-2023]|nr:hypothetical protein BSKO_06821 [Bryopsis sp. KO-2023]
MSRTDEKGNTVPIRIGLSNLTGDSDILIAVILPASIPKAIFHAIVEEVVCLISMHTFSRSNSASADEAGHLAGTQAGKYIIEDSLMKHADKYLTEILEQGIFPMARAFQGKTPIRHVPQKLQNEIKEEFSVLQRASKHQDFIILHDGNVVEIEMDTEIDAEELKFMAWVLCHGNGFFIDSKTAKDFFNQRVALHSGHPKGDGSSTFARVFGEKRGTTALVCFEHTGNVHPPMEDASGFAKKMKKATSKLDSFLKKGGPDSNGLCEHLQKMMCIAPTVDGAQNRKAAAQSCVDTKDGFSMVPIEEPDSIAEKENSTILKGLRTPQSPPKRRSGKYQISSEKAAPKESDGVFEWSGLAELIDPRQGEKGVTLSHRSKAALLDAQTLLKRAAESRHSDTNCSAASPSKKPLDSLGDLKRSLESSRLGPADPRPYRNHEELNAIRNFSEVEIHVSTEVNHSQPIQVYNIA